MLDSTFKLGKTYFDANSDYDIGVNLYDVGFILFRNCYFLNSVIFNAPLFYFVKDPLSVFFKENKDVWPLKLLTASYFLFNTIEDLFQDFNTLMQFLSHVDFKNGASTIFKVANLNYNAGLFFMVLGSL